MRAALYSAPQEPTEWQRWSFDHLDSHQRIIAAVQAQKGYLLTLYPIDPVTEQTVRDMLQFNSQLHIDMNGALNLQSADLLSVDFKDQRQKLAWIDLHAREHENVERALGL